MGLLEVGGGIGDFMSNRKQHIIKDGIEYKECSKCKALLPLCNYRKDNSKWDGLHGFCKECSKESDRKGYYKNPKKKYEKVLEYQRRTGRLSKYKPYNPEYYSSEKSKMKKRARDLKRRVLKKNADLEYKITYSVIDEIKTKYDNKCAYCGKECSNEYHIDHKLPLSRGGGNNIDNLALSCPTCNLKKNNKTDVEFIGHKV